jgi:hypothetical protein
MIFEQVPSGGDRNFSYLIGEEKTKNQIGSVGKKYINKLPN